jgi:foldase protein PrsA
MTIRSRKLSLLAVPAAAVALAACGGEDVPSNGVAKVGDTVIEKSAFNHWLGAAARGQQPPGGPAPVVPDPPNFTKCVAAKGRQPQPEGAPKPTPAQLKEQCEQEFDALKEQVMQFLVTAEWIKQEAADREITVTDAEVRKQFEDQKKQSFPDDKAYKEFLKSSGQTEQDLLFRVRLDVLSNKVRQAILKGAEKVTDQDITEYYEKNKQRFAQPERRDLAVVLTRTEDKAEQAREALEDGQSFSRVARRFSIDEATKQQGGELLGVAKGQNEQAFDEAIFKAKRGELVGPVKTQFGYRVFKVTKITPAQQQSLEQAKETIRNLVRSEREQKALDDFINEFRERYRDETQCADGYVIPDCKNAPKQTDTGPASGGAPQPAPGSGSSGAPPAGGGAGGTPVPGVPQGGAPPQGAPPQGAPPQGAPPQGAPPQGAPPQGAPPPQQAPPPSG